MITLTEEMDAGEYNRIDYHCTAFEAKGVDNLYNLLPEVVKLCEDYDKDSNGLVFVYTDFDTCMKMPFAISTFFVNGEEVDVEVWDSGLYENDALLEVKTYWEYPDKRFKRFLGENAPKRLSIICGDFSEQEFKQRGQIFSNIKTVDWKLPL